MLVSASTGQPGPPSGIDPPGWDKALAAKQRHAERLLDMPGVAGVGVGVNRAGKPVLRVYREQDNVAGIPGELDDVPVESVTTGVIQARAPTDRFPRPVPIGVSSGHLNTATGTLGARVVDGSGNVYALSNNHVFAAINEANIGDGIIQPGNVDGGNDPADRIGTLHDFQQIVFNGGPNTLDAAIALTSTGDVGTATPVDGYGTPSSVTTPAFVGQAVQKYGRTTGLQLGTVVETNLSLDVCYVFFIVCFQTARFVNQVAVTPDAFSAGGDSGSLIVTQGGNQPVALLFAGGEGRTIGNPIDLVLQRFGVTIDSGAPPTGPPSAPRTLTALAGDASVSLSWTAPAQVGGSPITEYKVYRGQSAGSETFLASSGAATTYSDASAQNSTTYHYKVSAVNGSGEGPLSTGSSATPAVATAPVEPLPLVDSFNRANENPLSDAGRWSNGVSGSSETGLQVTSNTLACTKTTTCTAWRNTPPYGPDVEVRASVSATPGTGNAIRLYARLNEVGAGTVDGYMLRTNELSGTDQVFIDRIDNGTLVNRLTVNRDLAAGDILLLRAEGSTLEAWHRQGSTWSRLGTVADSTYPATGLAGLGVRGTTGRLDDFGARTLGAPPPPPVAPGAPTNLQAIPGDATVSLTWTAPGFDGGVPLTGYKVYRGVNGGAKSLLTTVATAPTSFQDSGLTNGSLYAYEVSAVNQAPLEGPRSNEASATPTAADTPVEPLPLVDSFNRANENPLWDAGRWSNGVNGSGETGLQVTSSAVSCTKTTTCTAWRNATEYGPDTEVWMRVSTLSGNGNAVRLYARLKEAGSAAVDGYLLRVNELSGTDQVLLDRVDNGAFVNRLTVNRDLAAGDILLLRAEGSTLEAWHRQGSTWSRLGTVADSTYPAAGLAGLGVRGTTGRLDDFGARTLGAPPPPPVAPGAPTNLQAAPGDATVSLTWAAPSSDGGVPLTGYKVYRGVNGGAKSLLTTVATAPTSFQDSGLTNGSLYAYEVSAVNQAPLEGPRSNEASATPTAADTPVEPLPLVDSFNRANENPLSDAGSWSNGVDGNGERGLYVTSNALAGGKTTTTTAWRNASQYGPDAETWATVTTLPGNGNAFRLYVRVQQPGSSAIDAYMLLFVQSSGTDSVALYRITNGALTSLASATREVAVGNRLLVRAKGSVLEAWVKAGSTWTRVAQITDTTYPGAGYAGVAIRGTSGRLDDFGAR